MSDTEARLADCLARLLRATVDEDAQLPADTRRAEFEAAREEAAKTLLGRRVRTGEPWLSMPHLSTFFEQWCDVTVRKTRRGPSAEPPARQA
jgi:hypothetical protein